MMWGYNRYYNGFDHSFGLFGLLIPFAIFDLILRGFALWKSAKKDQNMWFIALLVVNSMGILPLIYLILNRDQKEAPKKTKKSK
jgi:hypothetical protein